MKTFIDVRGKYVNLSRVLWIDGGRQNKTQWRLNFHMDAAASKFDTSHEYSIDFEKESEFDTAIANLRDLVLVNITPLQLTPLESE